MTIPSAGVDRSLAMEILAAVMTGFFDRSDGMLEWWLLERPDAHGVCSPLVRWPDG